MVNLVGYGLGNPKTEEMKFMGPKGIKLINCLRAVDNIEQLQHLLQQIAKEMKFDYFAFGLRSYTPITKPQTFMFSNYSEEWKSIYTQKNYLERDPTVIHGLKSMEPIVWTDSFFENSQGLWESAKAHDLHYGWAQSIRDQSGCGMMTFARTDEAIGNDDLNRYSRWMYLANLLVNERFRTLLSDKLFPNRGKELTSREKEVLRWTAIGKTSAEISLILGITIRTVNFHVNNSIEKLDAVNKTSASVKAIMNNLLM